LIGKFLDEGGKVANDDDIIHINQKKKSVRLMLVDEKR